MSGRRDKLPIEPLSSEAWQRIHTEVFAELDAGPPAPAVAAPRRRSREIVVLVAAFLAVIGAVVVTQLPSRQHTAAPTTSRLQAAASSTQATVGDVTVEALPGTELVSTGSDAGGWTVVIERGRATFAVPPRAGRPAFRVLAGSVTVEVVGTEFSVEREAVSVRVSVQRGSVRVTSGAESRVLSQGQHWQSTPPASPRPRAAELVPDASAKAVRDPSPPAASRPKPPPTSRERYEAASRLEASDPERAVALYLELSEGNDAWAANALYAAGRLELERGRHAAARRLLQRYLERFPAGPNASEARALLARSN